MSVCFNYLNVCGVKWAQKIITSVRLQKTYHSVQKETKVTFEFVDTKESRQLARKDGQGSTSMIQRSHSSWLREEGMYHILSSRYFASLLSNKVRFALLCSLRSTVLSAKERESFTQRRLLRRSHKTLAPRHELQFDLDLEQSSDFIRRVLTVPVILLVNWFKELFNDKLAWYICNVHNLVFSIKELFMLMLMKTGPIFRIDTMNRALLFWQETSPTAQELLFRPIFSLQIEIIWEYIPA